MARYEIWNSTYGAYNLNLYEYVTTVECTEECCYELSNLQSDTRYWIIIREVQGASDEIKSAFSTPMEFKTKYVPPNGWNILLSEDGLNYTTIDNNITTISYLLQGLTEDTTYYSKIQVSGFGNEESNIISFTTLAPEIITIDAYDEISYDLSLREDTLNIISDNQMIINEVTGEYRKRQGLYNRNDFIDDSDVFHYIINDAEYSVSGHTLINQIDNGDTTYSYEYNQITGVNIGTNVDKISINELCSLVDDLTGYETLCKIVDFDATAQTIDVYVGYDYDRNLQEFGKTEYLYDNGYDTGRDFTLKILRKEMPIISKYTRKINENDKTEFLRYPILPEEEYVFYQKFDIAQSSQYEFTNLVEEIDNIYDTFDNTDLLYNQEINQDIPVYIHTNKLGIKNSTDADTYTYYTTYDNSNIELTIERADDGESNLKCTLKNTIANTINPVVFTPLSTVNTILEVDDLANYNVGDCIVLHEDNALVDETKEWYNLASDNKYTIESMFEDTGQYYIVLDGSYPLGNENTNLKFKKYDYTEIIHLQDLYFRGNPVIEEVEVILNSNLESQDVSSYGVRPLEITGDIIKKEDLEDYVNYLSQQFVGLDADTSKFLVKIETSKLYDIKTGDVVTISDPIYTGLNNEKMLVVSKTISRRMSGTNSMEAKEEYTLFMISSFDKVISNTVTTKSKNNYSYVPNTVTTNSLADNDLNDTTLRFENKELGAVVIQKVEKSTYKAKTNSNLNFQDKLLDIYTIVGDKENYNPLIYNGEKAIIKIGNEFMYVEGNTVIDETSTSATLKILYRDLMNTGQNIISKEQDVTFYVINSIV